VLGKLSGRNAFKQRLQELGIELESEAEINTGLRPFKDLADRKSEIFDEDILALVSDESVTHEQEQYGFVSLSQHSETGERPHASVVFTVDGKEVRGESDGNGPVDASTESHRNPREKRRRNGAVFGQRHQWFYREPGRGHRAPAELGPGGQWRGR
jgi:2-isopropylmalate synthase